MRIIAEAVIAYQKLKYEAVHGENIRNHNVVAMKREETRQDKPGKNIS